jgi:IS605 OrfB family transposase
MASFHRNIPLYKRLTPIMSGRNIINMNNEKSTHIRTQQILIRKPHEAFRGASVCTQIVRRIKNATSYLMQHHPDGKDQRLSHRDADKWLKRNNSELYTKLPAAIAQRSTQIVGQEWTSYFAALRAYKKSPHDFKAKPRKPGYAYKAATVHIGRNGFKFVDGTLHFANGVLPPIKTHFRFSQTWNALVGDTVALEVRIVPKGNCFIIEIIYNESKVVEVGRFCRLLDTSRRAGIDLGINNLIALATDQPGVRPVLINGKALKSINALYNKRVAKLRSQGKYAHIRAMTNKRNRRIKDLLHRASSKVASYCLENNIGTLVIGYNKHWKQEVNIGRVNNQKFVGIPHAILMSQIQYKCHGLGITTVIQEESYTSKASALDNDFLPVHGEKPRNAVPIFSGKRIRRGLYKSKHGIINADINGALNILRKATGEALGLTCKGFVFNPIMMDLLPSKSVVIRRENTAHQIAA